MHSRQLEYKEEVSYWLWDKGGRIHVKLRGDRKIYGKLHIYDQRLNMIVGDIEVIINTVVIDDKGYCNGWNSSCRSYG